MHFITLGIYCLWIYSFESICLFIIALFIIFFHPYDIQPSLTEDSTQETENSQDFTDHPEEKTTLTGPSHHVEEVVKELQLANEEFGPLVGTCDVFTIYIAKCWGQTNRRSCNNPKVELVWRKNWWKLDNDTRVRSCGNLGNQINYKWQHHEAFSIAKLWILS